MATRISKMADLNPKWRLKGQDCGFILRVKGSNIKSQINDAISGAMKWIFVKRMKVGYSSTYHLRFVEMGVSKVREKRYRRLVD